MNNFQVAIDGPAGSGKSSISSIIANKLGFTHIDTGAMYRAVCLEAMRRGINLDNESEYTFVDSIDIKYTQGKTYLNGEDVSEAIRKPEVSAKVSSAAKVACVREKMVFFQRESAKIGNVLMDGRDIGSVVLPDADIKIFLTASVEERAKRRMLELKAKGESADFEEIKRAIAERDYKDSHREISPLVKADDAIEVDTTVMSIDEVCNTIMKLISERMGK